MTWRASDRCHGGFWSCTSCPFGLDAYTALGRCEELDVAFILSLSGRGCHVFLFGVRWTFCLAAAACVLQIQSGSEGRNNTFAFTWLFVAWLISPLTAALAVWPPGLFCLMKLTPMYYSIYLFLVCYSVLRRFWLGSVRLWASLASRRGGGGHAGWVRMWM